MVAKNRCRAISSTTNRQCPYGAVMFGLCTKHLLSRFDLKVKSKRYDCYEEGC